MFKFLSHGSVVFKLYELYVPGGIFEKKRKCSQEDTFSYSRVCPNSAPEVGDMKAWNGIQESHKFWKPL